MILIDTGYLIALADPEDELHDRAICWSRFIKEPAVVTEYVLLETVNYFSRADDRPRVHALVDVIASTPGYQIVVGNDQLFRAGLSLHRQRLDKHWSLTDCISFVVMAERGIRRALAYDHHFEQAGYEALLRVDPKQ